MLESHISRSLLAELGISVQIEPDWIHHLERLITIGYLAGKINGMPPGEKEAWIAMQVGRVRPGFPAGITREECETIYAFANHIEAHFRG